MDENRADPDWQPFATRDEDRDWERDDEPEQEEADGDE